MTGNMTEDIGNPAEASLGTPLITVESAWCCVPCRVVSCIIMIVLGSHQHINMCRDDFALWWAVNVNPFSQEKRPSRILHSGGHCYSFIFGSSGSNISLENNYLDIFSLFSWGPPGKCWDSTLDQARTTLFHILPSSLFTSGWLVRV
jgi:hypothetical protein